jgi:hypothetical protein
VPYLRKCPTCKASCKVIHVDGKRLSFNVVSDSSLFIFAERTKRLFCIPHFDQKLLESEAKSPYTDERCLICQIQAYQGQIRKLEKLLHFCTKKLGKDISGTDQEKTQYLQTLLIVRHLDEEVGSDAGRG